ncbi:MAG TPA: O-antigen ligase family protein [Roseiflexaceae bacterium]|nr:O-antigen ligase family protein [Roseiflexaceae bacterium]
MIARLGQRIGAGGTVAWGERLLQAGLPLLLGLGLGVAASVLITGGRLIFLVPLACAVPAAIVFLRYPLVAVFLWALVFPFVVENPAGSGRVVFTLIHRASVPAAFGLVVLADWLRVRRQPQVRFGRAELAMLCFLLLVIGNIVVLTAELPQIRQFIRFYDRLFVPFCMYWLIRLYAPGERDLRRLAWVAAFVVVTQVVIGLIGWFRPAMLPDYWLGRAGERTVGTLGNPAVFSTTLLFFGLIALRYAMQPRSWLAQSLLTAVFGLAYVGVAFSFSRGSWMGALLVLVGLLALYPRLIRRPAFIGIALVGIVSILLIPGLLDYAERRLQDQDTAQGRVLSTVTQLTMIQQRPAFGWGYDTYDLYDELFKQRVGDIAVRQSQTSHNQFLLIGAELGLLGLALYLFPALWWLRLSARVWRRLPERGMVSRRTLAMLWLLLLHHVVVNNFMEMFHAYPFGTTIWWMALALIATMVDPYLRPGDVGAPRWVTRAAGLP